MTDWADFTSVTSADTAVLTLTVSTSFSSQESVNHTSSFFMKQFMVTMRINWFFKCWLLNSSMFEEKRVKFRPWLQQIDAKLNVNMLNNTVSIQFWYIYSQLEELTLSQVTSWIVAYIKSNKVLNHMTIEKLINQLWHAYNNSESRERATHTLKALNRKKSHSQDTWPSLNRHCWKQKA